jgi:hypothetical protein
VDHHEAAAADIAGARIGHGHREPDRDRGIDRVAAAMQNLDADARRARLLRHHHAVLRDGGRRLQVVGVAAAVLREGRSRRGKQDCEGENGVIDAGHCVIALR